MSTAQLNLVVGIATTGRCDILRETIELVAQQTRVPDLLLIAPARDGDVNQADLQQFPTPTRIVDGDIGSAAQRNTILRAAAGADVVVFFDDDFFPQRDYLAHVERIFLEHPDVVAITGRPAEDGIRGPGLSVAFGHATIARMIPGRDLSEALTETFGAYGCNMAFRMAPICQHAILFDENLPLYGWQEDIDFSSRLAAHGRMVESKLLEGVHLGAKRGRSSGLRFGYSQVANPVYLMRKGSMPLSFAVPLIGRNMLANLIRSIRPEPWIDRRGRLKGNLLAWRDLATGRLSPRRILQMK